MVDLAIPLAGGLVVVLIRAAKKHSDGSRRILEDIQKNAFLDVTSGALVIVGINAVFFSTWGVGFFPLESFDIRVLILVGGIFSTAEGLKQIHKNIFSRFPNKE